MMMSIIKLWCLSTKWGDKGLMIGWVAPPTMDVYVPLVIISLWVAWGGRITYVHWDTFMGLVRLLYKSSCALFLLHYITLLQLEKL